MNSNWINFLFLLFTPFVVYSQTPCSDPIVVQTIDIIPACGGDNGRIVFNILPGAYTWNWSPAVSSGPVGTNLPAGNYTIHIDRNGQPDCVFDTTITILSYPSAPSPQVASVTPSNCLASNGSILIEPANYNYVWSNTEIGAFNDGLNSGTYTVTATEPGTGCQSVITATVPNVNPLNFLASVTYPSKCGRNTGEAIFSITGGSGVYSYSLGNTEVKALPAGSGFGVIVDNISGCADTAFYTIPIVTAVGTVAVSVNQPRCSGGYGNIVVDLLPGDYFKLPYTFSITTSNGTPVVQPDSIYNGTYLVYVVDADSCVLPAQPFTMSAPAPIEINAVTTAGDCSAGGTVQINASGGTGTLTADWKDLNGYNNPFFRAHLLEGQYDLLVFDSLFCKDSLLDITVKDVCQQRDTFQLLVASAATNSFCLVAPAGLTAAASSYTLLNPSTSSAFGNWSLVGNCLYYTANTTTGFKVDFICIKVVHPILNKTDTVCISVSILAAQPTKETVYFTTQINVATAACGTIPSTINPTLILPLNVSNWGGTTAFGIYQINGVDACINYTPFDTPQFFADSISVGVCDAASFICHFIHYVPSILPYFDCSKGILNVDSLTLPTVTCEVGARTCLNIPYSNVLNFNILDNSKPYNNGALGCNETIVLSYSVSQFPTMLDQGNGPYYFNEWFINSVPHTGVFSDLNELLQLMNVIDPIPGWYLENFLNLVGGDAANSYGPLRITNANNLTTEATPATKTTPLGSEFRFTSGEHYVILKKIQTGCSDTLEVNVQCYDCPPIHDYVLDLFGNISWEAPSCGADTLFQTNIPYSALASWDLFDNNLPLSAIASNNDIAFTLDTGYHLMRLRNRISTCEYFISFYSDCRNAPVDTIYTTIKLGEEAAICPLQSLVPAPIITID